MVGSQMNKEVDSPASRGGVEGRSGVSLGLEPQDLRTQRIRRHLNFLRFCLENLSGVDPREFAVEVAPILGRLDLLREEGVDVSAISKFVEELFDSGRQYESIVVCSARERRVQEIQPLLASLEESIRTKSLERESLQAEDVAAASLKSEVESLKQEMEVLRSRIQEKEALLNPEKAETRAARIKLLDQDLQEQATAHEALVTQLEDAANNEARKTVALRNLRSRATEILQGALDILPS